MKKCSYATTNFDSWMSKGTHIIIGLFEVDETIG
jgi:hypothetical protein